MTYVIATFALLWIYGIFTVLKPKKRVETAEEFMARVDRLLT